MTGDPSSAARATGGFRARRPAGRRAAARERVPLLDRVEPRVPALDRGRAGGPAIDLADLRRLDRLANQPPLRHYAAELRVSRRRGLEPFVTRQPLRAAHLDPRPDRGARRAGRPRPRRRAAASRARRLARARSTVREFRKYAAYLAWKLGEPRRPTGRRSTSRWWWPRNGYVNVPGAFAGYFPPGAFSLQRRDPRGHATWPGQRRRLRRDPRARPRARASGPVHNMIAFTPADPASARDRTATRHADYVFNRALPERGGAGPRGPRRGRPDRARRAPPRARGKADYIGLNYYFRSRVTGLGDSISDRIKLLDFLPTQHLRHSAEPGRAALPDHLHGLRLGGLPGGLPALAGDGGRLRAAGLRDRERAGRRATTTCARATCCPTCARCAAPCATARRACAATSHWSLVDNFEWAAGYYPRFGFFSYDPDTLARRARPSARLFRRIARSGNLP